MTGSYFPRKTTLKPTQKIIGFVLKRVVYVTPLQGFVRGWVWGSPNPGWRPPSACLPWASMSCPVGAYNDIVLDMATGTKDFQNNELKKRIRIIRVFLNRETLLRVASDLFVELGGKWFSETNAYICFPVDETRNFRKKVYIASNKKL